MLLEGYTLERKTTQGEQWSGKITKVCLKEFPMGSFKGQKSAGFHMEEYLRCNLNILAEKIADDQMFVILITGSGQVRIGKSVLAQQIGKYLTWKVNELHKVKNKFDLNNITFKGSKLQEKAFQFPKYSVLDLDEGDDLIEHYWSVLAKNLRRFFRKAGQLNHFVILVLPDFFELPKTYAITRSSCLINVEFVGKFERGFFGFYNFKTKKELYLKGKKFANYKATAANFRGRFANVYTVPEKEYRKKKVKDMEEIEEEETKTPYEIEKETEKKCFKKVYSGLKKIKKGINIRKLSSIFGFSHMKGYNLINEDKASISKK